MLYLFLLFSPHHWDWEPEYSPDIPLSPVLIWLGRALLAYLAVYVVFLLQAPIDGLMSLLLD